MDSRCWNCGRQPCVCGYYRSGYHGYQGPQGKWYVRKEGSGEPAIEQQSREDVVKFIDNVVLSGASGSSATS